MNLVEHVKEIERKYQAGQEIFRRQSVRFLLERISQLEQFAHKSVSLKASVVEPLYGFTWHCSECGEWHSDKEFTCPNHQPPP
jgi:rubrerythrin